MEEGKHEMARSLSGDEELDGGDSHSLMGESSSFVMVPEPGEYDEVFDDIAGDNEFVTLPQVIEHLREEQELSPDSLPNALIREEFARAVPAGGRGDRLDREAFGHLMHVLALHQSEELEPESEPEPEPHTEEDEAVLARVQEEMREHGHLDFVNKMHADKQLRDKAPALKMPEPLPPTAEDLEFAHMLMSALQRQRAVKKVHAVWFIHRHNTSEWLRAHGLNVKAGRARANFNVRQLARLLSDYIRDFSAQLEAGGM